jgi:hypothetical protein
VPLPGFGGSVAVVEVHHVKREDATTVHAWLSTFIVGQKLMQAVFVNAMVSMAGCPISLVLSALHILRLRDPQISLERAPN